MGASDELKAIYGDDWERSTDANRVDRARWVGVCRCGHLQSAHAASIGGSQVLPEPEDTTIGGQPRRIINVSDGCSGAMPPRHSLWERFEDSYVPPETDGEPGVITRRQRPTCPCDRYREVAQVDRPHRFFNQPRTTSRAFGRHPLMVAMRTYRKRIGKLKRAQVSELGEIWANEEFDRRFRWGDGRRCDLSRCTETEDVWPVLTDDGGTALLCAKHRPD